MKNYVAYILVVCLVFSACGIDNKNNVSREENNPDNFMKEIVMDVAETLASKYNDGYSLDEQYIDEFSSAEDHADMSSITVKYANLWLEKAREYCKCLSEAIKNRYNEDETAKDYAERHNLTIDTVEEMQNEWEEYSKNQIENYKKFVELKYWGGTAGASALAEYEYDLYRSRAIELYKDCLLWGIEVSSL